MVYKICRFGNSQSKSLNAHIYQNPAHTPWVRRPVFFYVWCLSQSCTYPLGVFLSRPIKILKCSYLSKSCYPTPWVERPLFFFESVQKQWLPWQRALVLGKLQCLRLCRSLVSPPSKSAPTSIARLIFFFNLLCQDEEIVKQLCVDLRRIQQRNKCTDRLCSDVVLTLGKYLNVTPTNFRKYDKIMQKEAGMHFLALNGCPRCKKFVFVPTDSRQICPVCGGPRYDSKGKPLEVCVIV